MNSHPPARRCHAHGTATARELAADETGLEERTFPLDAPFTLEQTLDRGYLPD